MTIQLEGDGLKLFTLDSLVIALRLATIFVPKASGPRLPSRSGSKTADRELSNIGNLAFDGGYHRGFNFFHLPLDRDLLLVHLT